MHGQDTNNFSETAVSLYKDNVLCGCKAYNCVAMVDFTATILEKYYTNRLQKFANARDISSQ